MVSPKELSELRKAVQKELAKGRTKKEIIADMKEAGYYGGDINLALRDAGKKTTERPQEVLDTWSMETNMFSPSFLLFTLAHPTDTFKNLKHKLKFWRGLILYLVIATFSEATFIITSKFILPGQFAELLGVYPLGMLENVWWMFSDKWIISSAVMSIMSGLIIFLTFCWIVARLTKATSNGKADVGRTVGLLSYLYALIFIFVGLPLTIISILISSSTPITLSTISLSLTSALILVLLVVFILVWIWIMAGKAVAVANNIDFNDAMIAVLFAFLIVLGAIVIIAIVAGVIMVIGRFIPYPTGAFLFRGL